MEFGYIWALIAIAIAMSVLMAGAWAVQQRSGNSGWVDTIWTFSVGLVGVVAAIWPFSSSALPSRQWIVAALLAIWALRLGSHIALRTKGIADDPRYAEFARKWGADAGWKMFLFLQNQAVGSIPLVFGVFVAAQVPVPMLRWQDYLGVVLLVVGIAGEAIADAQLKRFRSDVANKGKVCDIGLWRWSRHPNYFFEWFGWIAYPVIAITVGYPWGYAALLGPIFMFWILNYVTGIPPLEEQMQRSRGDAYRAYQLRTSKFFPTAAAGLKVIGIDLMSVISNIIDTAERAPLPDALVRAGIYALVGRTATRLAGGNAETDAAFAADMASRAIAEHTADANAQHYEVPADFFARVLGPNRKYSSCFYHEDASTLQEAEEEALRQTVEHADLADGQSILELGCGWGSLSLWMARQFPNAHIVAVSNSNSQRLYIEAEAAARGLQNIQVVTTDMNVFEPARRFDRIVSVEMFEHMMNWRALLTRARLWLEPGGRLFIHIFTHRTGAYLFDRADREDWIAQHFFTGGVMPSHHLIRQYRDLFEVEREWRWSGTHYQRTANDWLANFDRHRSEIDIILRPVYGRDTKLWMRRWRWFFLATAGLFGHADGSEWGVSHYRLQAT